ncbi:hypothetical protein BB561_005789 [Smittium simulii]|uniref:Uncharacterized protein n=1 Tax=Smittium simulii TaxID=133385 RepID=A0A2T9Y896_9FUNG|nr:hypothetical protein BB561_005789 [Smittium simulii]
MKRLIGKLKTLLLLRIYQSQNLKTKSQFKIKVQSFKLKTDAITLLIQKGDIIKINATLTGSKLNEDDIDIDAI